ncbi:CHAPERONE DNAJ-DOMAIN SUPERFAMILY PROTEIN [Salix viminalis]|uniref:CHAPERONE DNAJ-DOMAIN SUPERFAMILY PROTEIN n=1 Tax=Salix viminalis TaxID=40686 RepID=A0A9Q0Z7L2_SALVM|nr:CHAPERONE DNAJ-DOMAIN SUPERFAMILY PROTEIN [Salix viminalis]
MSRKAPNLKNTKKLKQFLEDEFSAECEFSMPADESEKVQSCKSSSKPAASSCVVNNQKESSVRKRIDVAILKKEYRKKAMLVHPDKNLGSLLASESFKKLQCAYEVLSDSVKKRDYDEQLRKEESSTRSVCQKPSSTSCQDNSDYCSEESRRIQCTRCGNSHIWVCTNRTKAKARWCQDCCQYHQAKDGDGWVEYKGSLIFDKTQKMEIPRAFVCGESKIFDVSEWAICQVCISFSMGYLNLAE